MNNNSYYLNIGEFECIVVSDGSISVPTSLNEGSLAASDKPPHEDMDISCLIVKTETQNILIDTGCGDGFQDSAGKLVSNLKQEEINPEDIDTIIFTHGHEDHTGGTFDKNGKPVFPNAKYVVSRQEWAIWETKPETQLNQGLFASARKYLLTISDLFDTVGDGYEVIPGIKLILAPGHTFGSVMVQIQSGTDELLCIGDLIHSKIEFKQPEIFSFLDSDPENAKKLRTEGLSDMAQSGKMIFACHFPFPGIGYFIDQQGILGWQPI
jgi:glyoxylase-like metal-dependent hydrolase (beta-lactamase superfamily II)